MNGLYKKTTLLLIVLGLALGGCCKQPNHDSTHSTQMTATQQTAKFAVSVNEKKQRFFQFLLPLIHEVNDEVFAQQTLLEALPASTTELSAEQRSELQSLCQRYRIDDTLTFSQKLSALRLKVQTIPPSLVLAQAANESAWGNSRFAQQGNNFFGQWCFSQGCGLVPKQRNSGAQHEVARFDQPIDSVRSYIRNLNSHPSYELLRTLRQQAIQHQQPYDGLLLAQGLLHYSERGEEYIKEIQSMIRYNKLQRFDDASLTSMAKE